MEPAESAGVEQFVEEDEDENDELAGQGPAVESLTTNTVGREKLQVRGKGRAWKSKRGLNASEEGDAWLSNGEGKAAQGQSSRVGIEGERVAPGSSYAIDDRNDDEPLEESRILEKWLSEISIIPSSHFHTGLREMPSSRIRLAFDGNAESGPTVTLPLFKSAIICSSPEVPQGLCEPCKDVVMQIGGPVWALDWCPRRQEQVHPEHARSEFLAVGAHPCSAPYNRLGKPLEGQGLLQIWDFDFRTIDRLNDEGGEVEARSKVRKTNVHGMRDEENTSETAWRGKVRGRGRGRGQSRGRGRGRGRRSKSVDITMADSNAETLLLEGAPSEGSALPNLDSNDLLGATVALRETGASIETPSGSSSVGKRRPKLKESARARGSDSGVNEALFPRWHKQEGPAKMVMGLLHKGLVTWDAEWRPVGQKKHFDPERESFRLGFLALLLGDGSIEVFDVPLPGLVRDRSTQALDCTFSPTFVRMGPVFSCSHLQSGGHKSIPLCMEWSTWDPHDLILVGFHDATVGLWKFSSNLEQPEARPLMYFTADASPLRSVAWAPDARGFPGTQVFVTAGHSGSVKFWDIRDPFRSFWDLQVSRGCIHSLDWISWPRCLLMALDDGTLRFLGLDNASSSTPATGEPWRGTHAQGLQCYLCSSSPLWDAQICRRTGLVAYAGANGSVLQFQLTEKAIIKEGGRTREPHYLCGAFLAENESGPVTLTSVGNTAPAQIRMSSTEGTSKSRSLAITALDHQESNSSVGLEVAIATEGPNAPKKSSKEVGKLQQTDLSHPSLRQNLEMDFPASAEDSMVVLSAEVPANLAAFKRESPPDRVLKHTLPVHRVRWNCNPGREHWLTYGGSAGIVRCQQVFSMKKKYGQF